MTRRWLLGGGALALAGVLAMLAVPASSRAAEEGDRPLAEPGFDADLRRAADMCERGLQYLSGQLEPDGAFARQASVDSHPTLAICALGALAFMASGYTADSGPYMLELRRCIRWLLAHSQVTEAEGHRRAYLGDPDDKLSRMHGHGYATWALAMADGMSFGAENEHRRQELNEILQAAVNLIEWSQNDTGGWGYEPVHAGTFHEGSVTITQIQALRAAHDAGFRVDVQVIESAVQYVRNSQIQNGPRSGGFRYQLGSQDTSFALTAAAVSTLNQTGVYDSRMIDQGIQYMLRTDPLITLAKPTHRWYGQLYATQAYWQFKELRYFRSYYPRLIEELAPQQDPDTGAFSDGAYGSVYATAMACITLAVPFGYLPSFQR